MRVALIAGVMLLAGAHHRPGAARQEAPFGLAVTRLELSLDLDYDDGSLEGSATYVVTNESGSPVTAVPFNLGRLLTVEAAGIPGGEPLEFTQGVQTFSDNPRLQVNHVVVTLPGPLAPGSETRLRIAYGGFLVGYAETGSIYIRDRVVWTDLAPYREDGEFSILRADALAWPVPGTLSASANRSAPRPDFTFRAQVTVPDPYVVASAGRLVRDETAEGRRTFVYESILPVPFLNLPIARYGLETGRGVKVFHFPDDSEGARRLLDRTERALDLLTAWFGPLHDSRDVVIMEIPEMWGSQASLTAGIIQTADAFGVGGSLAPVYHELSHLWNARDLDLPSARWNEGLAMFLQRRMADELDGQSLREGVAGIADRVLRSASGTATIADVPFARYGEAGATDLAYLVGGLMFYALYSAMGEEAFDGAIREYYREEGERGWTFAGLMDRLNAHSTDDLTAFFQSWVYTTGWLDELREGVPLERIGIGP